MAAFTTLGNDYDNIASDDGNQQETESDCETLLNDAAAVGASPQVPDAAIEHTWASVVADTIVGARYCVNGGEKNELSLLKKVTPLFDMAKEGILSVSEEITGGAFSGSSSSAGSASLPPSTTVPSENSQTPSTTSTPISTTSTTMGCPSASPHVTVSISSTPDLSGGWDVTLTGTATNTTSAQVYIEGASAQVLDSSGDVLITDALTAGGYGGDGTLNPGQSLAMSSGAPLDVQSSSQPVLGAVELEWNWGVSTPYATCPGGTISP
jgi:large exoprotein involved in heme utilization and adhesion